MAGRVGRMAAGHRPIPGAQAAWQCGVWAMLCGGVGVSGAMPKIS